MLLDDYIIWLKNEGKSEKTVREYPKIVLKLATWYEEIEGQPFGPEKVTTLHIHEFAAYLDKVQKHEPAYVNKILAALKTFYKYAIEVGHISYNPMLKVKMKRTMTQYAAPKWLTKQETAKLFHALEQVKNPKIKARDMAICRMMSGAGLRVQEVSDLSVSDICLERRKEDVTIRGGKGNKFRIVPLNYDVVEALEEWMKYRVSVEGTDFLFIGKINNQISSRSIHKLVAKYAKKAGIEDVSPHTLRHTFCKSLADQGVRLERIAALAGHESIETTRRYLHPSRNDLRKDVEAISEKR